MPLLTTTHPAHTHTTHTHTIPLSTYHTHPYTPTTNTIHTLVLYRAASVGVGAVVALVADEVDVDGGRARAAAVREHHRGAVAALLLQGLHRDAPLAVEDVVVIVAAGVVVDIVAVVGGVVRRQQLHL